MTGVDLITKAMTVAEGKELKEV